MEKWAMQTPSNNIVKELDTKCIIIYWKPRNWKTLLASAIGHSDYLKRIYANFNIYIKKISINKRFYDYKEVQNIQYSNTHGVIIMDETWLNVNSKDSFSETNRIMHEVLFLSWKKNCDMIMIAQSYESVDVNFKRLAHAIFEVEKIKRYGRKPLFKINRMAVEWSKMRKISSFTFDTLEYFNTFKITYDTLETSKMSKKKEKDMKEGDLKHTI